MISRSRTLIAASLLFFACAVPLGLWACAGPGEVATNKAAAETRKAELDAAVSATAPRIVTLEARKATLAAERDALEAELDTIPASDPTRTAKTERLAYVKSRLAEITPPLEEVKKARDDAKSASDTLRQRIDEASAALNANPAEPNSGTALGQVLGAFIPGAAVLAPFLGGLAYRTARLARANSALTGDLNRKSSALDRIVASFDVLAGIAPEVGTAIRANAATIDKVQGPIAKAEVDAAQAKGGGVILPSPAAA